MKMHRDSPVGIAMVAKSPWEPAIRREHAFAGATVDAGGKVDFLELGNDIRSIRTGTGEYLRALSGRSPAAEPISGLRVHRRSVVLPGHRGALWSALDQRSIAARLATLPPGTPTVINLPWHWANTGITGGRKIFDLADDWAELVPRRADRTRADYRRIADEADEIIVATSALAPLFPGRTPVVVRNATGPEMLTAPLIPPTPSKSLVYVGTLSERTDSQLLQAVSMALPDWTIDLYGRCQYAGQGEMPGADLVQVIEQSQGQVMWHGPVPRHQVRQVLDAGEVLILPHRRRVSQTQDSMKLYDYSARGRPVVTTDEVLPGIDYPPHLAHVSTADEFVDAILAAREESSQRCLDRRAWAQQNTWDRRLESWLGAVSGSPSGRANVARVAS